VGVGISDLQQPQPKETRGVEPLIAIPANAGTASALIQKTTGDTRLMVENRGVVELFFSDILLFAMM